MEAVLEKRTDPSFGAGGSWGRSWVMVDAIMESAGTRRQCVCRQIVPLGFLVPVERIELPTFGLQNRCSTAELNRRIEGIRTDEIPPIVRAVEYQTCPQRASRREAFPRSRRYKKDDLAVAFFAFVMRLLTGRYAGGRLRRGTRCRGAPLSCNGCSDLRGHLTFGIPARILL